MARSDPGYYLNHVVNARYADSAPGGRVLRLPVLFVGPAHDEVADLDSPTMLDAMRSTCPDLTEATVPAGHWLQLEAARGSADAHNWPIWTIR
jgi:soluble epoxide hydrolase / lipid-phosphate phosphatase